MLDPFAVDATLDWPLGRLGIVMANDAILEVRFLDDRAPAVRPVSRAATRAIDALARYLDDPESALPEPVLTGRGTAFQVRVWRELRRIQPGRVQSYGDLARHLNTSPRAVGGACRANPLPLLVPCHRVVAHHGIGGFSGARGGRWLEIKRWLLAHEGIEIS